MSSDAWTTAGAVPLSADGGSVTATVSSSQGGAPDPWVSAGAVPASAGRTPVQAQTAAATSTPSIMQDADPRTATALALGQTARPSGLGSNAIAGAVEGPIGLIGSAVDAANPVNWVRGMANDVKGMYDVATGHAGSAEEHIRQQQAFQESLAPTTHKLNQALGAVTSYNPENTTATTFPERLVRGLAAGATGGFIFPVGEGEGLITGLARNATVGAGAGGGSATAAEVAPDDLKPAAAFLGGLAGGGVVGAGESAVQAARSAGMPGVVRNLAAGVSPSAAEAAAGRVLASRATDPAAAGAALEQPGELVPGSQPTTFQQTGDMGLGSLEREVAAKNPAAFQQRRSDQNAARVQTLGDIQQGADPNDVAKTLKAHFEDLDSAHEAAVDTATKAAQAKAAQFGGSLPADQYGQVVRGAMAAGERSAASHVSSFYDAIDPHGDLTGNMQATRLGAQQIAAEVGPTSKPMTADEADIFNKAMSLPDIAPASHLVELRKYVNAVARDPAVAGTPTSARLTQLRSVIDDNLANTISQQVANEAPLIERGLIEPSQSIAAKVQSEVNAWRAQRTAALAGGDGSVTTAFGDGAAAVHGAPGAEGQAAEVAPEGTGGAPPVQGTPSFDEAARQRLAAANQAAREKAQTWGPASIEGILAKDGNGNFRVPDGKVAAAFFHPGPSGFQHMQQALTAAPETLPALTDYAATTLRRAAMNEDGTLDPTKYERWRGAYTDALRALPDEAKARFTDAASATQALADARAARTAALKQAQTGAIGRVMNLTEPQDVTRTVGNVLNSRTAVADMKQLALATKGNAAARAGLRQAVADYISNKLLSNTEAGASGVAQIKADTYQTFIKNARPALHLVFSPEEVGTMEAVAEDIQRSNRSISAVKLPGGSNSPQDILGALKGKKVPGGHSMMNVLAAVAGEHQGGLLGAALLAGATHFAQALHGRGVARIDELVTQAMLNPKLAAELLKKAPAKPTAASFRPIAVALVHSVIPTSAATQQR